MKENLDLTKILAGCPKGTMLYSTIHGYVSLESIKPQEESYPISVVVTYSKGDTGIETFARDGRFYEGFNGGECVLFPSKECRDWSQFKQQQQQFKPFDKVIVCDGVDDNWMCSLYSHCDIGNEKYKHITLNGCYVHCLPFEGNEHLLGQQFKEEHLK